MGRSSVSKFAENPFLSGTVGRFPLMSEVLADTLPRAAGAVAGMPEFAGILGELEAAAAGWNAGETALSSAEAGLPAASLAFDDRMRALRRKPDAESNSLLEGWEARIRAEVAYRGTVYRELLPQGRGTLTAGSREEQLDALAALGERLAGQVTRPGLVALGAEVTGFYEEVRGLREAQTRAKAALEVARGNQEKLRVAAAAALYGLIGQGMVVWRATPGRVETLWDVNLLRPRRMKTPGAPGETGWEAAERRLFTNALPAGATRLEGWRRAPGGVPELLARGGRGETGVVVPAGIVFLPGVSYELWLCAANSRGRSGPGPVLGFSGM